MCFVGDKMASVCAAYVMSLSYYDLSHHDSTSRCLLVSVKYVGGAAQWYNVDLWPANFPCPALGLQLMGDYVCGKRSTTGQPTRPTQHFILSRSINRVVSCNLMSASSNGWRHLVNAYRVKAYSGLLERWCGCYLHAAGPVVRHRVQLDGRICAAAPLTLAFQDCKAHWPSLPRKQRCTRNSPLPLNGHLWVAKRSITN